MSKAGMKYHRRCLDNASQASFDARFVTIVAKQLHDLGLLSEVILSMEVDNG